VIDIIVVHDVMICTGLCNKAGPFATVNQGVGHFTR